MTIVRNSATTIQGGLTRRGREPVLDYTQALRGIRSAFHTADTKPCDITFGPGDSHTEGLWAQTDSARWQALTIRKLQRMFNPPSVIGGENFIPGMHMDQPTPPAGYTNLPQRWTLSGGASNANIAAFGLAQRCLILNAANQAAQITLDCDRFWIMYTQGSGAGTMSISIDGAAGTSVNTNNATLKAGRIWDSGPLTPGPHTVKVTCTTANIYLDGIKPFRGDGGATAAAGVGVRGWDAGKSGTATADWYNTIAWTDPQDNVGTDLFIIELGTNDYGFGVTVATYQSQLNTIVTNAWNARPTASIVLCVMQPEAGADTAWQPYREAIYAVATSRGCAVFDAYSYLPNTAAATPFGDLYADTIHMNPAGHRVMADAFVQWLTGDLAYKADLEVIPFSIPGPLAVAAPSTMMFPIAADSYFEGLQLVVAGAPTGSAATFDVLYNNAAQNPAAAFTSIYGATKPSIPAAGQGYWNAQVPTTNFFIKDSLLRIDLTAVGSTSPGKGLTGMLRLRRA